jgi:hypothetical protein
MVVSSGQQEHEEDDEDECSNAYVHDRLRSLRGPAPVSSVTHVPGEVGA